MRTQHHTFRASVAAYLTCVSSLAWSAPQFNVTDLGAFTPTSININGQIAGNVAGVGGTRAFVWISGQLLPIGTLAGVVSTALGINNLGHVVGDFYTDPYVGIHAFRYTTSTIDLGTLGGGHSTAYAINNAGQIVGNSYRFDGSAHAFLWENGNMSDLGTLNSTTFSYGLSINASGRVAGFSYTPGSFERASLFTKGSTPTDLSNLLGPYSRATGINDSGQVVGFWSTSGGYVPDSYAFLYSGGVVTDLGNLGQAHSRAFGINSHGHIVGSSVHPVYGERAFHYESGVMTDLNALIPIDSGWTLSTAVAINDLGQIVGTGYYNGQQRGFVLTPAPPPPASWLYPTAPFDQPYDANSFGRPFYYDGIHLGEDIALSEKTAVHAIGSGRLVAYQRSSKEGQGYGELVAVVEHDLGAPLVFSNAFGGNVTTRFVLSIYGHIRKCDLRKKPTRCAGLEVGDMIAANTLLGFVNDDANNGDGKEHLHLGIRLSDAATAKATDPGLWFRGYESTDKAGRPTTTFGNDFAAGLVVIRALRGQ